MTATSPFDETYGLELTVCNQATVEGLAQVKPEMMQVSGLVHGGVYAAMAETLASLGTNSGVHSAGQVGLGLSNQTSFLRPVSEGSILGRGHCLHSGRTTWVWDIEFFDEEQRLCALSTVTVAVRPASEASRMNSR
jgi:1,4-dihydroxy-2-naphthoyl-CoA hydrolase